VTNTVSNNVSVINIATNTVIATIPVGFGPFGVAFPTRGRARSIDSLIAQVQALVAGGRLAENKGAALLNKLEQVRTKIDRGQTAAACNQLGAFINQVNAFINSRSLTRSEGQALIDAANAVRTGLGC
jgi:YVTN family beta-propeller protein